MADKKDGAKTWMFTLNNWTQAELDNILRWDVTRLRVAEETGEEGTKHLQGCVTFKRSYRLAACKKLQSRAHWEVAKAIDCFNYEAKDGNVVHDIDNRNQGKRKDIDAVYECLVGGDGVGSDKFWALNPSFQHIRVAEKYAEYRGAKRARRPIQVIWIYGPPGYGKSAYAHDLLGDGYSVHSAKWWNGYTGQSTILIDDFRPDDWNYNFWLKVTDIYPLKVEVKGGMVDAMWNKVLITAPYSPKEMFNTTPDEDFVQIDRRITDIVVFYEKGSPIQIRDRGVPTHRLLYSDDDEPGGTEVEEGNTSLPRPAPEVVDLTGDD